MICTDNACERFALPIPANGCDCGTQRRRLATIKYNVVGDRPDCPVVFSKPAERFITMLDGRKVKLTRSAGVGR